MPGGDARFAIAHPDARDISRLAGDASGRIMFAARTRFRVTSISAEPDGQPVIHLSHPAQRLPSVGDGASSDRSSATSAVALPPAPAGPFQQVYSDPEWTETGPPEHERAGYLPAQFELESLKPIPDLFANIAEMLRMPRNFADRLKRPLVGRNFTRFDKPGVTRDALAQFSSHEERVARFERTALLYDYLTVDNRNSGGLLGARDQAGRVELRTHLGNPRILSREDDRYQVRFDAIHEVTTSVRRNWSDHLGFQHPGQPTEAQRWVRVPAAVSGWVPASEIHRIGVLDPADLDRLSDADSRRYQQEEANRPREPRASGSGQAVEPQPAGAVAGAAPALRPPHGIGDGRGTVEFYDTRALKKIVGQVQQELEAHSLTRTSAGAVPRAWDAAVRAVRESLLPGLEPVDSTALRFADINERTVRDGLGSEASAAPESVLDRMGHGGLSIYVPAQTAVGKVEQLVVLRAVLGQGEYSDSVRDQVRFLHDLRITMEVHPYAAAGTYRKLPARLWSALRPSSVSGSWNAEFQLHNAVRSTVPETEVIRDSAPDGEPIGRVTGSLREWQADHGRKPGADGDYTIVPRPYAAPELYAKLRVLIDSRGPAGPDGRPEPQLRPGDMHQLVEAASWQRLDLREAMGDDGYLVEFHGGPASRVKIGWSVRRPAGM